MRSASYAVPLLLATTYFAFQELAGVFGPIGGYLGGFLVYCIGWCILSPRPGGTATLVVVAGLMGLMWGWVARGSGSNRWPVVSHILFDFTGLGGRIYL